MTKEQIQKIKEFVESPQGKDVKEFLLGKFNYYRDIRNIKDCETDKAQALETKSHKKALGFLEGIYLDLMDAASFEEVEKKKDEDKLYNLPE